MPGKTQLGSGTFEPTLDGMEAADFVRSNGSSGAANSQASADLMLAPLAIPVFS